MNRFHCRNRVRFFFLNSRATSFQGGELGFHHENSHKLTKNLIIKIDANELLLK